MNWRIDIYEIDHGDHQVYGYSFSGPSPIGAYLTEAEARVAALEYLLSRQGSTIEYRLMHRTAQQVREETLPHYG